VRIKRSHIRKKEVKEKLLGETNSALISQYKQLMYIEKELEGEEKGKKKNFHLKLESSVGKHQLPQVHLKLPERARQLPSRKNKALRYLITSDMIHIGLLLFHYWLHKHLPLFLY